MSDSRPDTYAHITLVRENLLTAAMDLITRGHHHDESKLVEPELSGFNEWTPKLDEAEYGSPEYKAAIEAMKPFLDHHYAENDHHPEHYENGIEEMTLLSVLEMLCDWIAAGKRPGGTNDIHKSIDLNRERFGYGDELARLLHNTAELLEEGEWAS